MTHCVNKVLLYYKRALCYFSMAYQSSRSSSVSYADSGISSDRQDDNVNPRFACFWLDGCQGMHEFDHCQARKAQLRGKLGIYYSPNTLFKRFTRDNLSEVSLQHNPTGCTMISLLIYKYENDQIWLLFINQLLKENHRDTHCERRPYLALLSSNPRTKGERPEMIAQRAMELITAENTLTTGLRSKLKRFLFIDAFAIYPLFIMKEQADLLDCPLPQNTHIQSLHWFPLATIQSKMSKKEDFLKYPATNVELAQIRQSCYPKIDLDGDDGIKYHMWYPTTKVLNCIHNYVEFDQFLSS